MNGSPATGIMDLGSFSARAPIRVARPPASSANRSTIDKHLGAREVEAEAHLAQPGADQRVAQPPAILGVEEQEAAAAGADQLAAEGAVTAAELVPGVDLGAAHARRAQALALPVLVHERGERP